MRLQQLTTAVDPAPLLREAKSKLESARSHADRATMYMAGMQSGASSAMSAASSAISEAAEAVRLLRQAGSSTSKAESGISDLKDGILKVGDYLSNPDEAYRAIQAQNEFRSAATSFASAASSL
jgi:hypothetical protein